ncbi:MAG TPA: DUF4910 domain-containing protein [Bacteroidota bacterium]|nr:DUF4910 domain-containing protein [Bacteroidota bacterium]
MYDLISELYPICRSITGDGVRRTLEIINRHVPLTVHEVCTGTKVFDWTVPREWNIRNAYIRTPAGEKIADFAESNLHVVNYSLPVSGEFPLHELRDHLFTLPEHPDWVPYRTSFFRESWGFCLSHRKLMSLKDGMYQVLIDSTLKDGSLTYGEAVIPGRTTDEVLISTHICHPSLCNDNLSGISLATQLARSLKTRQLRYSYRFLFIPSTIGSITWLSQNEDRLSRIMHGLVLACVGDSGMTTYKKSRRGNAEIDRAMMHALRHSGQAFETVDFFPFGYDERQYCSPGFDLPVGCLMRTPHGKFKEYHTSADNLDLVRPEFLADSYAKAVAALEILENNRTLINQNPKCEPQLGRRGLYRAYADQRDGGKEELAMLWVLNMSDGRNSLLDIADKSGLPFELVREAADLLQVHGLLGDHAS